VRVLVVDAAERSGPTGTGIQLSEAVAEQVVAGRALRFGLARVPDVAFDANADYNREHVLLRVRAFSLNYRDAVLAIGEYPPGTHDRTRGFGSDFVGDVVATGSRVRELRVGDRVIPSTQWPPRPGDPSGAGVVTNHASRELQRVSAGRLVRVPAAMDDVVAACFPIGAQTAYGMLRRAQVTAGSTILVTAATSATSLFAIAAAGGRGARVYALSGGDRGRDVLARLGVVRCFDARDGEQLRDLSALARELKGFDAVVDPFCDTYLLSAVKLLGFGGHYVTCRLSGLAGEDVRGRDVPSDRWLSMMMSAVSKNVTLHGQCLGERADLESALRDWEAGRLDVVVDSWHATGDVAGFVHRAFGADRVGKVAYVFDGDRAREERHQ
jgi:NADPH:quinone reductase-like Zn-dependent oxidoreductase